MTKITIIGEEPQKKNLKPIEFVGIIMQDGKRISPTLSKPKVFKDITVLKVKGHDFDCVCVCSKGNNPNTYIYTANFNDGIV